MNAPSESHHEISPERLIALELRQAIAHEMDWLTEQAQAILHEIKEGDLANAQINGLLSIAVTGTAVTSITRFLEKQGSRRPAWQRYAEKLIPFIRTKLLERAKEVALAVKVRVGGYFGRQSLPELEALTDPHKRLPEIHLLLTREFIQSFATGYLYARKPNGKKADD